MGGELDLTAAGGTGVLTFDWDNDGPEDPDDDTEDLVGLAAGTYTVTVTDANGCTTTCDATLVDPPALTCTSSATDAAGGTSTCDVILSQPPALTCTTTSIDLTCNGVGDGQASAAATGGVGPYTYLWDDPAAQTTAIATGLVAGTYTMVVTDANGCTTSCDAIVAEPSIITVSYTHLTLPTNREV